MVCKNINLCFLLFIDETFRLLVLKNAFKAFIEQNLHYDQYYLVQLSKKINLNLIYSSELKFLLYKELRNIWSMSSLRWNFFFNLLKLPCLIFQNFSVGNCSIVPKVIWINRKMFSESFTISKIVASTAV